MVEVDIKVSMSMEEVSQTPGQPLRYNKNEHVEEMQMKCFQNDRALHLGRRCTSVRLILEHQSHKAEFWMSVVTLYLIDGTELSTAHRYRKP